MGWMQRHDRLMQQLSPEVRQFVLQALQRLEQENVCDAPGVISGVLRQMRMADSPVIRQAAAPMEALLKMAFLSEVPRRVQV